MYWLMLIITKPNIENITQPKMLFIEHVRNSVFIKQLGQNVVG